MEGIPPYIADLRGHLKLSRHGDWWHDGRPFQNSKLAALFHRSIVWDPAKGAYLISIGRECATFECEGTPYFVASLDDTITPWRITLLGGHQEELAPETLCSGPLDQVYCSVFGSHRATLLRGAHQVLAQHVVDETKVQIGERAFELSRAL